MSRSVRLLTSAIGAAAAAVAIAPSGASAATPGTVALKTDGQPVVARIVATEQWLSQSLKVACVDREPAVSITGAEGGTAEIKVNLTGVWVPSTILGGITSYGRAVVAPGTTKPLDLIGAFNYQTGGSGVIWQLPIGRGRGTGTLNVTAQTNIRVAGLQVPAFSNVIAIKTSLRNDLGGTCPSGRTIYV